ncbi:MAG: hypothetical protein ABSG41_09390 [Bryobacteraceae bacterium]|jgi:hypothetical protein
MNVVRPYVRGMELPAAMHTNLAQLTEYRCPSISVEIIGLLVHLVAFYIDTRRTAFR